MFRRKPKITLYENEEILNTFKLKLSQLITRRTFGNTGHMYITNQRIICDLSQFNINLSVFHDNIISFNWGRNIPTEGTRFTMLYSCINNFGNQGFMTVELRVHNRRKIKKILQTYPYYEKPQIMPTLKESSKTTSNENSPEESQNDPLKILKARYAKGEISKEEFEEMKKDLEI